LLVQIELWSLKKVEGLNSYDFISLGFKFKTREIIRFSLKPYLSIGFKI